jgi:glycosyltransferase involved in cell wall biosynthesis
VDFLPKTGRGFILNKPVTTSFIQKLPKARKKYRAYLPLMPLAVEQFDLSGYDLVLSSSYAVAKGSGMSYVNRDGETGLIVETKNPKALAEAINRIFFDKDLYKEFSQNAKERFKEFEIQNIGERMVKLYQKVLS